jgi:hypothetical protein
MSEYIPLVRVADGFTFPTSLAFAPDGTGFIAEAGLPLAGAPAGGRVWRVDPEGRRELLLDQLPPPVTGLTYAADSLWITACGQISRLHPEGRHEVVLANLPHGGNYHTNAAVLGADSWVYFSQGAMTNSGIVGLDAYEVGWLRSLPHPCDTPGYAIVLRGFDAQTRDPRAEDPAAAVRTGAFVPFGTPGKPGLEIGPGLPCTAAVMRCRPDGSDLQLVAWGLRNAFGLGFLPDGRLFAIDQGADDRGSRPLGNVPDLIFEVRSGTWCGWPDFIGGEPVTDPHFLPDRGPPPQFLLANHHALPPPERALYRFPPHVAATKFDAGRKGDAAWEDLLAIALFGDEMPLTAPLGPRVGRAVLRLNPDTGSCERLTNDALLRPIDVRFEPTGGALNVLDFGHFEMAGAGEVHATPGSGVLWRVGT